ncbi:MAG: glycosyltransferase [Nitrospirota bacterium]
MNILYHHRTRGRGVEGVHINSLASALGASGHTVRYVGPPGTEPPQSRTADPAFTPAQSGAWSLISRHAPEQLFELCEVLYNGYAWWRLGHELRQHAIDLIYERYALFSIAGVRRANNAGIPLILEVNDAAGLQRVRTLNARKLALAFERRIFHAADAIITISQPFKRYIAQYGVPEEKITVLSNAADVSKFHPSEPDPALRASLRLPGGRVIGFIGSFAPWHGVHLLVEAVARLAATHPDVHLLLVGAGPEIGRIRRLMASSGLEARVRLCPPVAHHQVARYIDLMDVAVMPDSNTYGSPMKIFEYMAMGKCVVAPSYEPIREVLTHGVNGLLFSPGDVDGLARALSEALADASLRSTLGRMACADVQKTHNWQRHSQAVLDIYQNIVSPKPRLVAAPRPRRIAAIPPRPTVTIIMPVYNEERFLPSCLDSILAQDYPADRLEVVIIDGGSTDNSRAIIRRYQQRAPHIRLLDNPRRVIPAALNIGWRAARGEIVVRMDAHTLYDAPYVRESVRLLLSTGAGSVGAMQRAEGTTFLTRAIALATNSGFGAGNAHFRCGSTPRFVDTAYLGAWRRSTLEELRGFDEEWLVNEDYELNYRLRVRGYRVYVSPALGCRYFVRGSLASLARQYFRYGYWKAKTARVHPDSLLPRQLIPPMFVMGVVTGIVVSPSAAAWLPWLGWGLPVLYAFVATVAGLRAAWSARLSYALILPAVFATLHVSWGSGFLAGMVRFGPPAVDLRTLLRNERQWQELIPPGTPPAP